METTFLDSDGTVLDEDNASGSGVEVERNESRQYRQLTGNADIEEVDRVEIRVVEGGF